MSTMITGDSLQVEDRYVVASSIDGTLTATNSNNNLNLTGIGLLDGLEIGDVIQISGSVSNNSEYTVEVITDDNNIIVNQAHAGGTTTKSLVDETSTSNVTVKLLCKWYNASEDLGRGWVDVTASRSIGVSYPNDTGRGLKVAVESNSVSSGDVGVYPNEGSFDLPNANANAGVSTTRIAREFTINKDQNYSISNILISSYKWVELR